MRFERIGFGEKCIMEHTGVEMRVKSEWGWECIDIDWDRFSRLRAAGLRVLILNCDVFGK